MAGRAGSLFRYTATGKKKAPPRELLKQIEDSISPFIV
jgi:hypothetical protein